MSWLSAPRAGWIALLLCTCGALGCERHRGTSFRCRCHFLTDFDDPSTQPVEICAQSATEAPAVARGCAQSAAPAPIQSCSCQELSPPAPCSQGSCLAK